MTVLVLGGYGASGAPAVEALRAIGEEVLIAGRDPARADRLVDLRGGPEALAGALDGVGVVLNAAGVEDPRLVAAGTARGAAWVDITASTSYVAAVERLAPSAPVLLSVGLAPGLTNLLAADVHAAAPGPVDIALVIGTGERHGRAGVSWALGLLGTRFPDPVTGAPVRNYGGGRAFALPGFGRRRLLAADFSDQHVLTRDLGDPVRTWFGLDSRAATALLAALTRVPGASRLPPGLHLPGSDHWLALARGHDGTTRWARGRRQARATGVMAALAARRVAGLPPGVHHLHRVATLGDVPLGDAISLALAA